MDRCTICGREIDGSCGNRCDRCDKIAGDVMADLAIELQGDAL